ncbi:MAG: HAD family hydrolase [Proteobacteria bacterium]|nr:HAD family hydrolase [Pseudomonadota bacterium]
MKPFVFKKPWPDLNLPIDLKNEWVNKSLAMDTSSESILNNLKEKLLDEVKASRVPAVLLDLDSTLLCVNSRSRSIFSAYLRTLDKVPDLWWKVFFYWNIQHHTYSIRETIENVMKDLGTEDALQKSYFLWKDFESFWMEHFFSSRFMDQDEAYEGAVQWVREIKKLGLQIVYLSGRDRISSMHGTLNRLQVLGFPMGEGTRVFLKPGTRDSMTDLEFKIKASELLSHQYRVLLSIDNEPENLIPMAKYFPEADIVWKLTVMSWRIPEDKKMKFSLGNRKLLCLTKFANQ